MPPFTDVAIKGRKRPAYASGLFLIVRPTGSFVGRVSEKLKWKIKKLLTTYSTAPENKHYNC